ncbi:glycosyltransferase family 4 protein [Acidobacteriota bacterium]
MKKILVISPTFPLPLDIGSKIRIYYFLEWLSHGNQVDMASLSIDPLDRDRVDELKNLCDEVVITEIKNRKYIPFIQTLLTRDPYRVHKFRSQDFYHKVVHLLEKKDYDIIWCNFLNMLFYLEPRFVQNSHVILDMHNEDELVWKMYGENSALFLKKLFAQKNIANIRRFRLMKQRLFDLVLSVSERDRQFTQSWLSEDVALEVVNNGVDIDYYRGTKDQAEGSSAKNILFCGSMDIAMNQEAVKKFVSRVFPRVKKDIEGAKFWIVGRYPPRSILKLSNDSIAVTGNVNDVRPYYAKAAVAVAPFEFGGGTKLKILEALASKVPMVSTSLGAQGLDVRDGEHLIIRDDWNSFGDALVMLFKDENLRKKLAANGYSLIEKNYSWEAIMEDFQKRHPDFFS